MQILLLGIFLNQKPGKYINISGRYNNAVVFYADAGYINKVLRNIWSRNFMGWFLQAFLVSVVTLLLIRWGVLRQVNKIVEWVKAIRTGNIRQINPEPHLDFLDPLHKEIESIAQAMNCLLYTSD